MNLTDKIYIAGHRGLVSSALMRNLRAHGHTHLLTRTHAELDLTNQQAVQGHGLSRVTESPSQSVAMK